MQTRGKHRWHPIPLPPQPLSGRYCFTVDTPCDACGYNLRSLPLDARCPECGTPASLGAQTLPHHWPAEVRWRLAAIIAAALVSPALRLVWVSVLLLGFLDSADVGTLRAIAMFTVATGLASVAGFGYGHLSQHRVLVRLHRRRRLWLTVLGSVGDATVGAGLLLALKGHWSLAAMLVLLGLAAGCIAGLQRARHLDDLAHLLIRVDLGSEIKGAIVARCTFELVTLAAICLLPLAFLIVPLLIAMVLIPIGIVAAVLMAVAEVFALVRLLHALYITTHRDSADPGTEVP